MFPLATKRWVSAAIRNELRTFLDEFFQGRVAEPRAATTQLRADLDLLLVHSKRIDENLQALTNLATELRIYSHKNVHDLRNLIQVLQSTVEDLREMISGLPDILKPPRTIGAGAGEELGDGD